MILTKGKGRPLSILLSSRAATSSCAIINKKTAKSCDTASLLKAQVMYLFPGWKGGSDQVLVCWIRLECSPRSSCVSPWKEVSWIFQLSHLFVWEGSWIRFWLVGWVAGNIGLDCSLLSETTSHVWQNSHNSALFWHTFYFGTLFPL